VVDAEREGSIVNLLKLQEEGYKEAVATVVDSAVRQESECHSNQLSLS